MRLEELLETELASFREDLLKIKKEKNKLNSNIKTIETENEELAMEKDVMKKAVKDLEAKLKVRE